MPEPRVIDLRQGLTLAVLDELKAAQRVTLAIKNQQTAVLGTWRGEQLTLAVIDSESLWKLPPPRLVAFPSAGSGFIRVGGGTLRSGVVLDIPEPQASDFWSRLLGLVRPGDVLRLGNEGSAPGLLVLKVFAERAFVGEVRLPRAKPSQQQAA